MIRKRSSSSNVNDEGLEGARIDTIARIDELTTAHSLQDLPVVNRTVDEHIHNRVLFVLDWVAPRIDAVAVVAYPSRKFILFEELDFADWQNLWLQAEWEVIGDF